MALRRQSARAARGRAIRNVPLDLNFRVCVAEPSDKGEGIRDSDVLHNHSRVYQLCAGFHRDRQNAADPGNFHRIPQSVHRGVAAQGGVVLPRAQ